ncbi:hypothetical protein Q7C36_003557 [Tachysurus vachellii]|uniref:Nuclear receptor domain-containing protein n=1 Tax=Tachysurus vachellii TaxID=175792 RepID=A0AA88T617_TACVA|nr:hypothetical protein Q7C36_003557 [Tachysurus vachellii]
MEDIESGRDPSPYRGHTSHRAGPEEEEGLEKVLLELNVAPNINVELELHLEAEPGVEMTPGWGQGYDQLDSADEGEPENSRRSITEIQIPVPTSASGFHYGVHACEGCMGFFRCTVRMKLEYEKCEHSCKIHKKNRNKCQYCRFRKCVMLGMSHDAIRYGRMPEAEKRMLVEFVLSDSWTYVCVSVCVCLCLCVCLCVCLSAQCSTVETVRQITEFAKCIPEFIDLYLNDQWQKVSGFVTREFLRSLRKPFSEIMEPKFEFALKFNALELDDSDLALFFSQVEEIQDKILQTLDQHLQHTHPDALLTENAQLVQMIKKTESESSLHPLLQEIYRDMY